MTQWILTLIVGIVLSTQVFAKEAVEGFIVRQGESLKIRFNAQENLVRTWDLKADNPTTQRELDRLNTGDYVLGDGTLNTKKNEIQLRSVNFVGLGELLGLWRTDDWEVFEFEDFNRLNLYRPRGRPSNLFGFEAEQLTYRLAPDLGQHWSIFIVNKQGIDIGHLQMIGEKVRIELLNPTSGEVDLTIHLTPVVAWRRNLN